MLKEDLRVRDAVELRNGEETLALSVHRRRW